MKQKYTIYKDGKFGDVELDLPDPIKNGDYEIHYCGGDIDNDW